MPDAGTVDDAVEDVAGPLGQRGVPLRSVLVEDAEIDRVRRLGVHGEADPIPVQDGDAEGVGKGAD